jgi:hypothetical protein
MNKAGDDKKRRGNNVHPGLRKSVGDNMQKIDFPEGLQPHGQGIQP